MKQRQILFGWVHYTCPNTNWAGIQTFPRTVTLDPANATKIVTNPIEEIRSLYKSFNQTNLTVKAGQSVQVATGNQLDVTFSVPYKGNNTSQFSVSSLASADGHSGQTVSITTSGGGPAPYMPNFDMPGDDYHVNNTFGPNQHDPHTCEAVCKADSKCKAWTFVPPGLQEPNNSRCCLKSSVPTPQPHTGMTSGAPGSQPSPAVANTAYLDGNKFAVDGNALTLRVLIDHSVVEVYAEDGRAVATHPFCPPGPTDDAVFFHNTGTEDVQVSVNVHVLETANVIPSA